MGTPAPREPRTLFPDLFDLLEAPFASLRPFTGQAIRVEDYIEDGRYVIRAELPGIDPDRNLEINVSRGVLSLHAERQEEHKGRRHSEFRYGSYDRQLRLPENAKDQEITASYENGILTVSVPLEEAEEAARRVPVKH